MNAVIIQAVEQLKQNAFVFYFVSPSLQSVPASLLCPPGEPSADVTFAVSVCREVAALSASAWQNRLVRLCLPHTLLCALTQTHTTVCLLLLGDTHISLLFSFLPPGLKVNRLDMYGEKYKPFKGIKYMTKAGKFQVRT